MQSNKIFYIQFYRGELADIERWAVEKTLAGTAKVDFVDAGEIDQLGELPIGAVLGAGPFTTAEHLPAELSDYIKLLLKQNIPLLGIDYGFYALANVLGYATKLVADVDRSQNYSTFVAKNATCELNPPITKKLRKSVSNEFCAFHNNAERLEKVEPSKVIFACEADRYAGVEFNSRTFGVAFLPFLDQTTAWWWCRPYPEFWLYLTGFLPQRNFKRYPTIERLLYNFNYRFRLTAQQRKLEDDYLANFISTYRDVTLSQNVLRQFVTRVVKS